MAERQEDLDSDDEDLESDSGSLTLEQLESAKAMMQPLFDPNSDNVTMIDAELSPLEVCGLGALLFSGHANYPSITKLILRRCKLRDEDLTTLMAAVGNNPVLTHLDLAENWITHKGVYHLLIHLAKPQEPVLVRVPTEGGDSAMGTSPSPKGIIAKMMPSLRYLNLEYNEKIRKDGMKYLSEIIEANDSLVCLNISGTEVAYSEKQIAKALKANSTLKHLFLDSTGLDSRSIAKILLSCGQQNSKLDLEELSLSLNPLQDSRYFVYTPLFINEKFSNLRTLHLNFVQLFSDSTKSLSRILAQLLQHNFCIEHLYLRGNLFDNEDCIILANVFKGVYGKGLVMLDLSDNCIEISGASTLLLDLEQNDRIQHLILDENRFLEQEGGDQVMNMINRKLANNRGEEFISEPPIEELNIDDLEDKDSVVDNKDNRRISSSRRSRRTNTNVTGKYTARDSKSLAEPRRLSAHAWRVEPGNSRFSTPRVTPFDIEVNVIDLKSNEKNALKQLTASYIENAVVKKYRAPKPEKPVDKKKSKSKSERIIDAIRRSSKPKNGNLALADSIREQEMISASLSRFELVTPGVEYLQKLRTGLIPSVLLSRVCDEASEQKALPLDTLDQVIESLKVVNMLGVIVLTALAGPRMDEQETEFSGEFLHEFARLKSAKNFSEKGITIIGGLILEIINALLLVKPMIAYSEAFLLVVNKMRGETQPDMDLFQRLDAKLDVRAQKNINKKVMKSTRDDLRRDLQKKLLRLRDKAHNEDGNSVASSAKSFTTTVNKHKSLEVVLNRIRKVHDQHVKKKKSKHGNTGTESHAPEDVFLDIPSTVKRYRANCAERVSDILDDLRQESENLSNLLKFDDFVHFLFSCLNTEDIKTEIRIKLDKVLSKMPMWFYSLQVEFKSQVLDHLLSEIIREIKNDLKVFDSLKQTMQEVKFDANPKAELVRSPKRQASLPVAPNVETPLEGMFSTVQNAWNYMMAWVGYEEEADIYESPEDEEESEIVEEKSGIDMDYLSAVFSFRAKKEVIVSLHEQNIKFQENLKKDDSGIQLSIMLKSLSQEVLKETVSMSVLNLSERVAADM